MGKAKARSAHWCRRLSKRVCLFFDTPGTKFIVNYYGMAYLPLTGTTGKERLAPRASLTVIVGLSLGFWIAVWFGIAYLL
jgi:hypothetical protein